MGDDCEHEDDADGDFANDGDDDDDDDDGDAAAAADDDDDDDDDDGGGDDDDGGGGDDDDSIAAEEDHVFFVRLRTGQPLMVPWVLAVFDVERAVFTLHIGHVENLKHPKHCFFLDWYWWCGDTLQGWFLFAVLVDLRVGSCSHRFGFQNWSLETY